MYSENPGHWAREGGYNTFHLFCPVDIVCVCVCVCVCVRVCVYVHARMCVHTFTPTHILCFQPSFASYEHFLLRLHSPASATDFAPFLDVIFQQQVRAMLSLCTKWSFSVSLPNEQLHGWTLDWQFSVMPESIMQLFLYLAECSYVWYIFIF
jgi:hypothetical protein